MMNHVREKQKKCLQPAAAVLKGDSAPCQDNNVWCNELQSPPDGSLLVEDCLVNSHTTQE